MPGLASVCAEALSNIPKRNTVRSNEWSRPSLVLAAILAFAQLRSIRRNSSHLTASRFRKGLRGETRWTGWCNSIEGCTLWSAARS